MQVSESEENSLEIQLLSIFFNVLSRLAKTIKLSPLPLPPPNSIKLKFSFFDLHIRQKFEHHTWSDVTEPSFLFQKEEMYHA